MAIPRTTLTSTTTVPDALAVVGGQAWIASPGTDGSGVGLIKGLLHQFQTGLDLPLVANLTATLSADATEFIGAKIAITTAGTEGAWVSGIFAQVTQGATQNVSGYISAGEFEIVNSCAIAGALFPLVLNFIDNSVAAGSLDSYIALRDYGSMNIRSLLWFGTEVAVGTKSATSLITTLSSTCVTGSYKHGIRILQGATPTPLWILATSIPPSS